MQDAITLGRSVYSVQQTLNTLERRIGAAAEKTITGKKADQFSDLGSATWEYLSADAGFHGAQHTADVVGKYVTRLESYGPLLDQMSRELSSMRSDIMKMHSLSIPTSDVPNLKDAVRSWCGTFVGFLNTRTEGTGYIFSGAQTDYAPVKSNFLDQLCAPEGPQIAADDIPLYFTCSDNPELQLPLNLYVTQEGQELNLPLQAHQMQDVFIAMHKLLSLEPSTEARTKVQGMQTSLDSALGRVKNAQMATSDLLRTFQTIEQRSYDKSSASAQARDALVNNNTFESSMQFADHNRALEAFLYYETAMMQLIRKASGILGQA